MREAPSLSVIKSLTDAGAKIRAFDPVATENARKLIDSNGVHYCSNAYEALEGSDALVIVTEWNEFRHPDFDRVKSLLKAPLIFDGRNLYSPAQMRDLGFTYFGIGRNPR